MDVRVILRTPMTPAAPLTKVKVILAHGNGIVLVNVTLLTPRKSVRIVVTGSPKTSRQKGIPLPVLTIEVTGTRGRDLVVGRISLPENRQIVMMRVIVMGRRHVEGAVEVILHDIYSVFMIYFVPQSSPGLSTRRQRGRECVLLPTGGVLNHCCVVANGLGTAQMMCRPSLIYSTPPMTTSFTVL